MIRYLLSEYLVHLSDSSTPRVFFPRALEISPFYPILGLRWRSTVEIFMSKIWIKQI